MRFSVVVTIVDAGDTLERCLTALATQREPPPMEVIVPWDDTVSGIGVLAARFSAFRFLPLGAVTTTRSRASLAGRHELYDRRRAAGLAASSGDIVAILEDRSVPRADWARTSVRLHDELPHAVIGGGILNGHDRMMNWAVYFCDFGRYQPPFEAGPREWVSDVNVAYKRRALDSTRELWRDRYHETTVHWALRRAGETLFLSPSLLVDQMRGPLRFSSLLGERFAWGRVFAYTRAREARLTTRWARALLAPLLPVVLFWRLLHSQITRRVTLGKFLQASPAVIALLIAWSLGEALGYVTGES